MSRRRPRPILTLAAGLLAVALPTGAATADDTAHPVAARVVLTGGIDPDLVPIDRGDGELEAVLVRREVDGTLTTVQRASISYDDAFSFDRAVPGSDYTVVVRDPGHRIEPTLLGDTTDPAAATYVRPTAAAPIDVGTITPGTGLRQVVGSYLDVDGAPTDTPVGLSLWRHDPAGWRRVWVGGALTPTYPEAPDYRTIRARPGAEHTLAFEPDGGEPVFLGGGHDVETAETFVVPAATGSDSAPDTAPYDVGAVSIAPIPGVRVTGRVVDPSGEPVAGAAVSRRIDGEDRGTSRTAADGSFAVRGSAGQVVTVAVSAADRGFGTAPSQTFTLTSSAQSAGTTTLPRRPGYVTGTIRLPSGEPVADGVSLDLLRQDEYGGWTPVTDFGIGSDPGGTWEYARLTPGRYYLVADNRLPDGTLAARSPIFRITDSTAPTTGVDVTLRRGVFLTGTVTGPDGLPRGGIEVDAHRWNGPDGPPVESSETWYAVTDDDGRYRITVPARTDVWVHANDHDTRGTGLAEYFLGGVPYPATQTAANSIDTGTGATFDIRLQQPRERAGVGELLRADAGDQPATAGPLTYQWYVDGEAVVGATDRTFRVRAADRGHRVTVRAGSATSAPVAIGRATSEARIPFRVRVTQQQRVTLPVSVRVRGTAVPTGPVVVREGGRVLARTTLVRGDDGRTRLRLPRLAPGRHHLDVVYAGSATVARATASDVVVVRR